MSSYFVAGTDTDVGKTRIASGLLRLAQWQGLSTAACKPVAAGCFSTEGGLRNDDALCLQRECRPPLAYELVNPVALEPPIAPHIAAEQVGRPLEVAQLLPSVNRVLSMAADFSLVEGAGGWRVPLNAEETLANLAQSVNLPVILVVGIRLGCISHALLTAEAIRSDGLQLAGWVANIIEPQSACIPENISSLRDRIGAPCLGEVPYLDSPEPENIARYLTLP